MVVEPLPGIRVRRLRLAGIDRSYDVDFAIEQRVRTPVWEILTAAGIDPAPHRSGPT